jgi:Tol biopolymer transport system component
MPRLFRAVRFTAAAALLPALLAADAQAQEKPKNGVIAFSAQRAGQRVIYTRKSNGTGLRLVQTGVGSDDPAFSVRGQRLLFTRRSTLGAQVWISYLNGQGQRQLTSGPSDGMAQWSGDGSAVVFARGRRRARDIYRVMADGTDPQRLTRSARDDHSPSWSKKNRIAFVRASKGHSRIYVISSKGGTARRLDHTKADELYPAWSPTGKTLVVSRGRAGHRDLYLVTASGSSSRRLTAVRGDEIEPSWSPDGTRIVFTYKRNGRRKIYLMKVRGKPIKRLSNRSVRMRRITTSKSRPGFSTWQPAGLDPIIDAAGDIACDPGSDRFNNGEGVPGFCRQKATSDLLLRDDLAAVLPLGDDQYEKGTLAAFNQSYAPSWGRMKFLTKPVVGNHEYQTANAQGYFDYFNGPGQFSGPAGDRDKGYYSFDIGSWHIITLNSECVHIGGCGISSPQMLWLKNDLATHPVACTMALWHRPHFTSGGHTDAPEGNDDDEGPEGNDNGDMVPAWQLLYNAGADVILNGHDHFYERFAPQTPAGVSDPGRGIREFIAGMGGKSRFGFPDIQPNSEFRSNGFYGVMRITLRDGSYDWNVLRAPTGLVDSGTATCH